MQIDIPNEVVALFLQETHTEQQIVTLKNGGFLCENGLPTWIGNCIIDTAAKYAYRTDDGRILYDFK